MSIYLAVLIPFAIVGFICLPLALYMANKTEYKQRGK
jgi:hypothetical protein